MKALIAIMVVAAALVVIAAEKQETKTEGKTFAQFPLTKRAAEVRRWCAAISPYYNEGSCSDPIPMC